MQPSGIIKSSYYEPHIYFIFSKDLIYIGETQNISVRRWSSHLDKNGSFNKKMEKHLSGISKDKHLEDLSFYSFSCYNFLNKIQEKYCGYKIPTQAIEHKIHEIVIKNSTFGSEKKVISETIKTAPRNFYHWDYIADFSHECINTVLKIHQNGKKNY